ncbi:CHAT domain-containing protein [Streptomyces sp. NPDC006984]|uniref:CHAT domain-containing protein n=1 Tax=Streptomyces sp. NPDC006984 TaxID=3155463 RepID=UPI0033D7C274
MSKPGPPPPPGDPKYFAPPLREECRLALRSITGFDAWSNDHHLALVDIYRWALEHDLPLHRELRRRAATRNTLMRAAADAWRNPGATDAAIELGTLAALCGDPPAMTFRFPIDLERMMRPVRDVTTRADCYARLVELLRDTFSGTRGAGLLRGGWVYLLADAGEAAFKALRPIEARDLLDEAWRYVDELPPDHVKSVKAIAHVATSYNGALCHSPAPWDEELVRKLGEALCRLEHAREVLRRQEPSVDIAAELLNVGLSVAQNWHMRRRREVAGWIDAETQRVAALDQAESDLWTWLSASTADTAVSFSESSYTRRLPACLRSAAARMLLERADATRIIGEPGRATQAAHAALELSEKLHHVLDARLTLASIEPDTDRKISQYEVLFRDAHAGMFDELNDWQRGKAVGRLVDAADDLGNVLYRMKRPTAAWFWKRQARYWASARKGPATVDEAGIKGTVRGPDDLVVPVTGEEDMEDDLFVLVSEEDVPEPGKGPGNQTERLKWNLRRQYVPGIVLSLMALSPAGRPMAELIPLIEQVDRWRPPRRGFRPGRLAPAECRTQEELVLAALEIADEFADGYARWLRPDLLNQLARSPGARLSIEARKSLAREAAKAATEIGRWRAAIRAQFVLLAIAEKNHDTAAVRTAATAIHDIVRRTLARAIGTADLIDIAHRVTTESTRLAGWLAGRGYDSLAFDTGHVGIGILHRMFLERPELAEEFELAEQYSQRTERADARLFVLMNERLATPRTPVTLGGFRPTDTATSHQPSAAFVQLMDTPDQGCWALGSCLSGPHPRTWAVRLKVTTASLGRLRDAAWHDLRDARRELRPTGTLRRLHREIIEPIKKHTADAANLVIIPHRGFAGIPVHAALGPNGYLIERCRVSYMPSLAQPTRKHPQAHRAIVGGWDPTIAAGVEAEEVHRQLRDLGIEVYRPPKAAQGRRDFLNADGRWAITHLAAHGEFRPWPTSMNSTLQLSESVLLTAGEWLREGCYSTFAFINACSVGRHAPHAGDLNGFPLALRARGTIAEVSALSPVPIAAARTFAQTFYASWPGRDSLAAYQQACQRTIAREAPPCDWAPYLHTGIPLENPASPAKKPRRLTPKGRASRHGRRRHAR